MAFDLFLSRAGSLSEAHRPGLLTRLGLRKVDGYGPEDLQALVRQAPRSRQFAEGVYWVWHPQTDRPWMSLRHDPMGGGTLVFSISYGHYRFPACVADAIDWLVQAAPQLGGRVFEEVQGREVRPGDLDGLLAPQGRYMQLQLQSWRQGIQQNLSRGLAPLEFPVGGVDWVSEYLALVVEPARKVERIAEALGKLPRGSTLVEVAPGGHLLVQGDEALVRIFHRPDGFLQFTPHHTSDEFARLARTTVELAEAAHEAVGGRLRFFQEDWAGPLPAAVKGRLSGLGVEFWQWLGSRPPPTT